MPSDKFSAVWVSHSSINDFLRCPRLYFLNNVYKNPDTGRKVSLTNPHLSLGQVVHDVLESLSELPVEKRFDIPLKVLLNVKWAKVHGKIGGFKNDIEEMQFKDRALTMLTNVEQKPGPILEKAIKLLLENCQKREIKKASYWYLDKQEFVDSELPSAEESEKRVMEVAMKIKEARATNNFACERSGCYACEAMEKILTGEAEFVGVGQYNKEIYRV